jgi:hypothetical protein
MLDGLLTYTMGSMLLPTEIWEALDARRRAFLWVGSDKVFGAQCLVAWENVSRPKEDGGPCIKCIETKNAYLVKLLHCIHHSQGSTWATWVQEHVGLHDLSGDLASVHWSALRDLLPAYRKITRVQVGNGKNTSFWDDIWFEDCLLSELLLALHNHFIRRQSSLKDVLTSPLRGQFQRRLSPQAARELDELEALVLELHLRRSPTSTYVSLKMTDNGYKLLA